MNASVTIKLVVFILFVEVAYPFIFRGSSENTNTVSRNVLKQLNPHLHQLVFPTVATTIAPNTTFTKKANFRTALSRLNVTTMPTRNLSTIFLNSTVLENPFFELLNFTETKSFNRTVENNTDSDRIEEKKSKSDTCSTGHDQQSSKKKNYLSDEYIRSKLCSNINASSISREYRFDLDAKVCSEIGKQSHCGKNMIFCSHSGNTLYGHCDCDHSRQMPLIYHPQTKRCYFMYQQGYCGREEWLEMTTGNKTAICTTNKCYNSGRSSKFGAPPLAARDMPPEYVPLRGNGPCVRLNQSSKQYCENREHIVAFRWPLEFYPNCGPPLGLSGRFLGDVASLECSPGSYLNVMGTCEPDWEFD